MNQKTTYAHVPMHIWISTLVIWCCLFACQTKSGTSSANHSLKIVTTTGILGDAVQNIVGKDATVESLMGPGVDPHLYKATQGDLEKLENADVIVYNGLHLEGKMGEILEKIGRQKPVIAIANGIETNQLRSAPGFQTAHDPHIWFDVHLWRQGVQYLGQELQKIDTLHAKKFQQNSESYLLELDSLHTWIGLEIQTIPPTQRVLITAHDAFGYFGRAYKIEVKGLQGISTVAEFGLQDISNLVTFITERKIKAVFVESSVPKKSIEAVVEGCKQRGHTVLIGGTLYSDALGAKGTPAGTYIGMVKENVATLVNALK